MRTSILHRRIRLNLEALESRDCPATIHVDFAGDNNVSHPGEVSLRDAISASINHTTTVLGDTGTGDDTIVFDSNLDGQTIVLSQNDADVAFGPTALVIPSGSITIDGGSSGVIIDGDSPAVNHRLFGVATGATLILDNITLENGEALGGNGGGGDVEMGGGGAGLGGAVYVDQGTLSIVNSTFVDNVAQGGSGNGGTDGGFGGGGAAGGNGANGVDGGNFGGGGGGVGGAASAGTSLGGANQSGQSAAANANGTLGGGGGGDTINNSTSYGGNGTAVSSAGFGGGGGGGVYGGAGGFGAGGGGGLYRGGAGGFGGGGGEGGTSQGNFGGLGGFGGGNAITGDVYGGGGGGMGGAVFNNGGSVSVISSTFTANSAIGGTGSNNGYGYGGAFFSHNGFLTFLNDTISGNTAVNGGRGVYVLGDDATAGVEIDNSIIGQTNNAVTDLVTNTINGGAVVTGGGHDLIRNTLCMGISIVSTADPLLNALASNGGPTQTMSLQIGSPAISAGDATIAPATDQRGLTRPNGPETESGAYALIGTSQYTYAAYIDSFYCYLTADSAYKAHTGSYLAMNNAYSSFYYAYYAFYDNATGLTGESQSCAYYAYYYGYLAYYYAYVDYADSGGTSSYSYDAFVYGYYDWSYSLNAAMGL